MKYIIFFSLLFLLSVSEGYAQFYTSSEIEQINLNKTANEGDFYLDTVNNRYYVGLTHGIVTEVGLDSSGIVQIVSNSLLDENDMVSDSPTRGVTQKSVKHYIDSLTTPNIEVSNELMFDGKLHANSSYHNYYYVSMKVDLGYCVVRYNKNDVNDESKAESSSDPQPITLNSVVGLTYN